MDDARAEVLSRIRSAETGLSGSLTVGLTRRMLPVIAAVSLSSGARMMAREQVIVTTNELVKARYVRGRARRATPGAGPVTVGSGPPDPVAPLVLVDETDPAQVVQ